MRRILALLLVIAMAVLMFSACGNKEPETTTETTESWETRIKQKVTKDELPEGKVLLSTLSNEELSNFITEHGVTIPKECADMDFKSVIAFFENDIYYPDGHCISYQDASLKLTTEIHDIVKEYYGYPIFYGQKTN